MATITVRLESFQQTIGKGIVLLDVWASWCPPCRAFSPVFEAASERHPDIVFGKLNTEEESELAAQLRIRAPEEPCAPAHVPPDRGRTELLAVRRALHPENPLDRAIASPGTPLQAPPRQPR